MSTPVHGKKRVRSSRCCSMASYTIWCLKGKLSPATSSSGIVWLCGSSTIGCGSGARTTGPNWDLCRGGGWRGGGIKAGCAGACISRKGKSLQPNSAENRICWTRILKMACPLPSSLLNWGTRDRKNWTSGSLSSSLALVSWCNKSRSTSGLLTLAFRFLGAEAFAAEGPGLGTSSGGAVSPSSPDPAPFSSSAAADVGTLETELQNRNSL